MRLILASASPRRAELLAAAGFAFGVHAVDIDERAWDGETPREYVERLALQKSAVALEERGSPAGEVILAADTAVLVDGRILGKPWDADEAADMLRRLSGRSHLVLTGVSLRAAGHVLSEVAETRVSFAALTDAQVNWYVASGEGFDKAGGYGIQGLASRFIPAIEGSYSNVVGLPIETVERLIQRLVSLLPVLASEG